MSLWRSRSGGNCTTSNASLSSRSARNLSCATISGRSALVAQTRRTLTCNGWLPPTRSSSPYSITRSSFSCTSIGAVASSSRNSVPPSARSKRPGWRFCAPVKAPASWPNSSESSRFSFNAAQFREINGPSQRPDKKCKRLAISSLPVPRSPMMSTGLLSGASRDTCSRTSRKLFASPRRLSLNSAIVKFTTR